MNGHRAIGFSLLCALVFCALAASNASASKGTTAFTCVFVSEHAQFADEHCAEGTALSIGWAHQEISPGTITEASISNTKTASSTTASTNAVLKGTIFGLTAEVICTEVLGSGLLTNEAGPPMKVKGSSISITYTGCTVSGGLGKQGCKTTFGKMETISATSMTKENSMEIEFTPAVKTLISFQLEKCKIAELNKTFNVEGTANANPEGATLSFTEASTKGLKLAGQPASLTSKTTLRMAGVGNPIAFTTTEP